MVTFFFSTILLACLQAARSQVSIVPLVEGRSQPLGTTGFTFVGSVTLVRDGATNIVVDTPAGRDATGRTAMYTGLTQNGLNPSQIQMLVTTHGHPDHFGHDGLFDNARHIYSGLSQVDTVYTILSFQNRASQLTPNVQLWITPGHSTQDSSLIVTNVPQRGTVAVVGDLIYNAADALDPATSQTNIAENITMLIINRNRVICASDYIVPGHGPMFQVTTQMRTLAQCAGGGGTTTCATNLNQILVNGQCYTLMLPNSNGCTVTQQCIGGSTCVNSGCRCPTGSTAVNNACTVGTGGGTTTSCLADQVRIGNQCIAKTPNQPCINVNCLGGGDAQCRGSYTPYSKCTYHSTLINYYCCTP